MNRCLTFAGLAAMTVCSATRASAQAIPAARGGGALAVGLTVSDAQSDYTPKRIAGVTGYATYDVTRHLGAEADVRFLTLSTPDDVAERTYMAGLRYVYRKNLLDFYGKGLAGIGQIVPALPYVQTAYVASTNFAAAFGVGLDIRLRRNITVRAFDFEYQDWPNFASDYGGNGLSPTVVSVGVAYRFR